MSHFFEIHPQNPQLRLVRQAADIIRDGGVVVYPTDSCYAIGCHVGDKRAMDRIARIRNINNKGNFFTLLVRDLSEISTYARLDNSTYRVIKAHTPGPYTWILRATAEVPRRLQNPKRKSIGIRVPEHPITQMLLEELGEPMLTSTLVLPGDDMAMTDPQEMFDRLKHQVDLVIDGGACGSELTTIISYESGSLEVLREGKGISSAFAEA